MLPRGNWLDDSGEDSSPAVPEFLPSVVTAPRAGRKCSALTRLDLARWMARRENPLTARVFVNRLWKLAFGQGIVAIARRLRLAGRHGPRTRNCSTGWPSSFTRAAGT